MVIKYIKHRKWKRKMNAYHVLDYTTPNNIGNKKVSLSVFIEDKKTDKIIQVFQKEIDLSEPMFEKMSSHQKIQYVNTALENFHLECIWNVLKSMDNEGEKFVLTEFSGNRVWENKYFVAYTHVNYGFHDFLKRFEDM